MRTCDNATATLIVAAIVLMAGGCGDRKNSSAPPSGTQPSPVERASTPSLAGQRDVKSASDVAKSVLDELPRLRESVPLSAWKNLHNTDTIEPYTAGLT